MSLFKVCNWWKTQCPDVEPNYDSFSIHCCRLSIQEGEKDNVIVGSHSGHLSIYQPSYKSLGEGESGEDQQFENIYQHSDVILETKLSLPIIGIVDGRFTTAVKTDTKLQLAILHPAKICIYQIVTVGGIADHGDQSKLHLLVEHSLTSPAFCFCRGSFGGIKGRDFLCIQHTNGSLRFFEQDGITFEYRLPGERHIPSPIHYIPRIDCFVTVSPSWELECYRYQDLSEPNETLRRHEPIWSICVGEYALDLSVHQISNLESVIVITGENNLICVTDTGKIRFIRKLDYSPVCFHSFVVGWYWEPDARLMIAVVSDSGSLLLYEENQVVWSAELPDIPVAICRANVSKLPGALVTLGSTGHLAVGFLGSEPHLFKVPPLNLAPFEVTKCQKEMVELEKEIRSGVDFSDIAIINAATEREIDLQVSIDPKLEKCSKRTNISSIENLIYMCQLVVTAKPNINLELMQICIVTDMALESNNETFMFRDIQTDTVQTLEAWIYSYEPAVPNSTKVEVSCSYTNKQGITRILKKSIRLPLEMLAKTCPATKEALHKVTLIVRDSDESLNSLFPEFISDGNPHAIGLLLLATGTKVTIVAARNTNRFRVQSEDFFAIPLIVSELIERINSRSKNNSFDRKNRVSISSNPPMDGLLKTINHHYQLRLQYKQNAKDLEIRTNQMRLFERRFVVKLQERSLRALDGILMLLKQNQSDISKICNALKDIQIQIKISQINLSGLLRLFELGFVHSNIPSKYLEPIRNILSTPVFDSSELSWEEMVQPVIKFLSHTGPLHSEAGISSFDEKFIFATDGSFRLEPFMKQFSTMLARVEDKRSKIGRSSADFEEQLEEVRSDTEESTSEWLSYEKVSELTF
ncbi:protein PTHB1 [Malaya genurostris]|uniref:protein PTHB1 n=1 Tax=Malaya genurostris TaxID=325434 RepID=UPI0026F3F64A|nr:protein PTHB1 [Malaya genurostris]